MNDEERVGSAEGDWGDAGVDRLYRLPMGSRMIDLGIAGHFGMLLKVLEGRSDVAAYRAGARNAEVLRFVISDKTALDLAASLVRSVERNRTSNN